MTIPNTLKIVLTSDPDPDAPVEVRISGQEDGERLVPVCADLTEDAAEHLQAFLEEFLPEDDDDDDDDDEG